MNSPAESKNSTTGERHVRTLCDREILFDEEDFFWDFDDWFEEAADVLAKEAGLAALDDRHWQAINFLRNFYRENGRAPLNRQLKKGTGSSLLELEALFPGGLKYGARRLAGLPNPKNCA